MSHELTIEQLDAKKIELLKNTVCKGASNEELELFIHICNRSGLDPFARQIYAIFREAWDPVSRIMKKSMTIQTAIDGYRLIAERTGSYMPGKDCLFVYRDNQIFSATAYVKKQDNKGEWHELAHTVHWDEYAAKKKDGTHTSMWQKMPHVMLGKCAEAAALRKAFPADMSGIYTKEEMEQANNPEEILAPIAVEEKSHKPSLIKDVEDLIHIIADPNLKQNILNYHQVNALEECTEDVLRMIARTLSTTGAK